MPKLKPRILIIEDNPDRIALFQQWLSGTPFVTVIATTRGQAMGLIRHGGEGVAGICLDHDLNSSPKTAMDESTSGSQVAELMMTRMPKHIPVLVHSMNTASGESMHRRLRGAGFDATRIRFAALDALRFQEWLSTVEDLWDFEE